MLSVLINTHLLQAAREPASSGTSTRPRRASTPPSKQTDPDVVAAARGADAYPAEPEDGYGWEKLFTERMCRHFCEDYGLETRVARYHNIYGPHGTWDGGREKAPAAICRKVAEAELSGEHEIEIWGDGKQTRSFMLHRRLRRRNAAADGERRPRAAQRRQQRARLDQRPRRHRRGSPESRLRRRYDLSAPQGVRGRNSDNTLVRERLGWEPSTSLRDGLERTYRWIYEDLARTGAPTPPVGTPS